MPKIVDKKTKIIRKNKVINITVKPIELLIRSEFKIIVSLTLTIDFNELKKNIHLTVTTRKNNADNNFQAACIRFLKTSNL